VCFELGCVLSFEFLLDRTTECHVYESARLLGYSPRSSRILY
jgi:hypothetical protein